MTGVFVFLAEFVVNYNSFTFFYPKSYYNEIAESS